MAKRGAQKAKELTPDEAAQDINFEVKDIVDKAEKVILNIGRFQSVEGGRQLTAPLGKIREILSLARIVKAHYEEAEAQLAAGTPLAEVKTAYSHLF
jgi:hypothetical protein